MRRFEPATLAHARLVAATMRPKDIEEVRQINGREPLAAITEALSGSFYARTLFDGFEPLCMYGLAPFTILGDSARLWMFSTAAVDRHRFAFARASRLALAVAMRHCRLATNLVALDDEPVCRWLEWLGCTWVLPVHERRGRLLGQFVFASQRGGVACRSA